MAIKQNKSVIPRLALDLFYLHIKFGDSRFSHSGECGDMIGGIEIENVSCDSDHAPFRDGLSSAI